MLKGETFLFSPQKQKRVRQEQTYETILSVRFHSMKRSTVHVLRSQRLINVLFEFDFVDKTTFDISHVSLSILIVATACPSEQCMTNVCELEFIFRFS